MHRADLDLRTWERLAIAGAVALFLLGMMAYSTDYTIFQTGGRSEGERHEVGLIGTLTGSVRRELGSEDIFTPLTSGATLFGNDTIVTGSGAMATLELKDGSKIRLEPNSMIHLAFEPRLSLSGITRVVKVDVVAGKVEAGSKTNRTILLNRGKALDEKAVAVEATVTHPVIPPRPAPIREAAPPKLPDGLEASLTPLAVMPLPEVTKAPPAEDLWAKPAAPVESQARQSTPSPTPTVAPEPAITRLEILQPRGKTRLRVPDGSPVTVVESRVKWSASPAGVPIRISLHVLRKTEAGVTRKELLSKMVEAKGKPVEIAQRIQSPGEYEWEFQDANGASLATLGKSIVPFTVDPAFVGIEPNAPLIGGLRTSTSRVIDKVVKDFDVNLSWKPYRGASQYQVSIASSPDMKETLVRKITDKPDISLARNSVLKNRMYYRVAANLPSGFTVFSPVNPFIFDFTPPVLTMPAHQARITRNSMRETGGGVLFTWELTNFTEEYVFELATDPEFHRIYQEKILPVNFLTLPPLPAGQYYWRVRSRAQGIDSGPGQARGFSVLR
ncbi:MAG TPA: FecR domain-containing protein [Bdellovibrionota bacterium]|nr:FecR domain-containing protein [Bdellovibrionota bacterium]